LAQHTDAVVAALEEILSALPPLPARLVEALRTAARWHDRGKAHPVFQATLLAGLDDTERAERVHELWAKSGSGHLARHSRVGFRHEFASGLAMLQEGLPDLAAYLATAHHGKLRLGLHSLPGELEGIPRGEAPPLRMARGIYEGDALPAADLGAGLLAPKVTLTLAPMDLGLSVDGNSSWQDRMAGLLASLGPFQLIYMEALLRAADARGSRAPIASSSPSPQS
jgi:CRISPR-associated endonuclease/helicase Cas3